MSYYEEYLIRVLFMLLVGLFLLGCVAFLEIYISLLLVRNTLGKSVKEQIGKRLLKKSYGFTIISYLVSFLGVFVIFATVYRNLNLLVYPIIAFITFISNSIFSYFIVFKCVDFSKIRRLISALIVSFISAMHFSILSFCAYLSGI